MTKSEQLVFPSLDTVSTDISVLLLFSRLDIHPLFSMLLTHRAALSYGLLIGYVFTVEGSLIFGLVGTFFWKLSALGVGEDTLSASAETFVPLFVLRQVALGAVMCPAYG